MDATDSVFETDVLVIGSGIAGCAAALKAKDLGADVLMVEQGKSGFWGLSTGGTHRLRVVLPEDDFDAAMEGTVKECEYMVDQEFLEEALAQTWDRLQELIRLGADFRRDDSGQIQWFWADTAYPDFKQRNVMWEPVGSYKHILRINRQVKKSGVKVLDRVLITDLITTDGKVNGAVGFNTRTGEFYLFKSRAVVVAAGGFSGGGLGNWPSFTGDGVAMGARAGAELRHMEFGKTEVAGILPDRGWPHWVFRLLNPQEEEVSITNTKGEEFLEKYELGRRLKGRKYYGAPWRVHLMAMFQEFKEGKGPCYVDYRAPNKAARLRDFWGSYFDRTLKQIELSGTTLDQIKYEIAISRGFSQGGGIRINARGESTVPGLYAGGQASDMCGVAQYTIVSGMMASMITAQGAGESAAKYALNQPKDDTDKDQVEDLKKSIYAPLDRKKGIKADDMRQKMTKAWVNVDIRDENRLSKAHDDFQALENETPNLRAEDLHELAKCHKISNYVMCSDAVAVSALARCETRLEHIRQDYPLTDNKEWLKWVIVRRVGGEFNTYFEDIPIDRWRYRPEPIIFNRLEPIGKE